MITHIRFDQGYGADQSIFTSFWFERNSARLPRRPKQMLPIEALQAALEGYDRGDPAGGPVVRIIGEALWDTLETHGNAALALQEAREGLDGAALVLALDDAADTARQLPWEALHDSTAFLALDRVVPVLREFEPLVRDSVERNPALGPGEPVRILAVLAAKGVDNTLEWSALRDGIDAVSERMSVKALVLTSEREVVEAIEAATLPEVTVETVPAARFAFGQRVKEFSPHYAHFFCHGIAERQALAVRSAADVWGGTSHHVLDRATLVELLGDHCWVVVLNACSLAVGVHADPDGDYDRDEGGGETLGLAEDLVRREIPVVIGMRAPVRADHASRFARGFTARALDEIAKGLAGGSAFRPDFGGCFAKACRDILSDDQQGVPDAGEARRAWTLPVCNLLAGGLTIDLNANLAMPGGGQLRVGARPGEDGLSARRRAELDVEELRGELRTLERFEEHPGLDAHVTLGIANRIAEIRAVLDAARMTRQPDPTTLLGGDPVGAVVPEATDTENGGLGEILDLDHGEE